MTSSLAASICALRRGAQAQANAVDALEKAGHSEIATLARGRAALEEDRASMLREVAESVQKAEGKLQEQRVSLEKERFAVEQERQKIFGANPPSHKRVLLNVGGARFETSTSVLTNVEDSMLGRMFGRCADMLQKDSDGSIFIDRDGARFRFVLDFLRDLNCSRAQKVFQSLPPASQEALFHELDFFGLQDAIFGVPCWTESAQFRSGPAMREGRSDCAAVFVGNKVFVFGGWGRTALNSTELLDAKAPHVSEGPMMLQPRMGCAAVEISADKVLVVGGKGGYGESALASTEVLNVSTRTFSEGPAMIGARSWCCGVLLDTHRLLIIGGSSGSPLSSTEVLCLDTMTFSPGPAMASRRAGCAAVKLDAGRVLVVGGSSSSGYLDTSEILDTATMLFAAGPAMLSARYRCAAVAFDGKHVMVVGGMDTQLTASFLCGKPGRCGTGHALVGRRRGRGSHREP